MKITTIKYMERKNLGNYEHEELTAEAVIDETEDYVASMLTLKDLVHNTLHGTLNKPIIKEEVVAEVVKKTKPKKEKVAEVVEVAEAKAIVEDLVAVEEIVSSAIEALKKEKPKKVTKYSSDIPEHKSIFGAYLAKKYGDTWKTVKPVADIKAFTASLNGKDFLDDVGTVVPSFIELVHGFFGA